MNINVLRNLKARFVTRQYRAMGHLMHESNWNRRTHKWNTSPMVTFSLYKCLLL